MSILHEASSPRGDHGVLKLIYGQPVKIPFHFKWQGKTKAGSVVDFNIDSSCRVLMRIKKDMRDTEPILEYSKEILENNCVILEINSEDSRLLKAEKTYYLGMVLYKGNEVIRVLLGELPIQVERSVLK